MKKLKLLLLFVLIPLLLFAFYSCETDRIRNVVFIENGKIIGIEKEQVSSSLYYVENPINL